MTTRYQKSQIEDVARILRRRYYPLHRDKVVAWRGLADDFADLFAADNPPVCQVGSHYGPCTPTACLIKGFDREQFLAAWGLEGEG